MLLTETFIGIDIGGTNSRFALVDKCGRIIFKMRQPTDVHLGRNSFVERILAGITEIRGKAAALGGVVLAVGAGIPGLVSNAGYIYSSVNLKPLSGLNMQEVISQTVGLPVVVLNDANAGALGEARLGCGRPFKSFLMLTLGTGVGGGLVLNRKLWTGIDGIAGEFGHLTVEPDGIPCACGNRGCLEQYSSATAIVSAFQKDESTDRCSGVSRSMTCDEIAAAARNGDLSAIRAFEDAGRYIGISAASAINMLNLEAVIIGGGVSDSFDLLLAPVRREIDNRAFTAPAARVEVLRSKLGDDAGILGSTVKAMELVRKNRLGTKDVIKA